MSDELTGRVAIITRTKNRPLLLKRAAQSVNNQTYQNFIWVVVNDGGNSDEVANVIERSDINPEKILFVNNPKNLGRDVALNVGIRNSKSEYVVIHDDDDSWSPYFLEKTVGYLNSSEGQKYSGCVTETNYISEEIVGDTIVKLAEYPYKKVGKGIQLIEILHKNIFPPIAFLYKRNIYDKIGGYNESLPVLEDWEFNIRFLMEADIGVLGEPLAYYHHRDKSKESTESNSYSNTVVGDIAMHREYHAILRNSLVRRYPQLLGILSCLGEVSHNLRNKIEAINYTNNKTDAEYNRAINALVKIIDDRWAALHVLSAKSNKPNKRHQPMSINSLLSEINQVAIPIPPDFDEKAYLQNNPEVAIAVAQKKYHNGYHHFLVAGRHQGKQRPTNLSL